MATANPTKEEGIAKVIAKHLVATRQPIIKAADLETIFQVLGYEEKELSDFTSYIQTQAGKDFLRKQIRLELWYAGYHPRGREDTMFFNVPEARQQLINKGLVYTLRPKMRRTGKDVAYYGSYYKKEKIGDVTVDFIRQITTPYELKEYVGDSGLEKVEDWWEAAEGSRFLFRVRLA